MKHLPLLGFTMIILISISCKKDSVNNVTHVCNPCINDSPSVPHLKTVNIIDSNWVGQGQYVFKSDLTQLIKEAGEAASDVYALELVIGSSEFQFFPCCPVSFHDGELSASIYSTGTNKTCTLTFTYTDQNEHSGERPNPGIPFHSTVIKVWLWK